MHDLSRRMSAKQRYESSLPNRPPEFSQPELLSSKWVRETSILSPWWLHQFIFPPTMYEDSLFSTFSPTLAISCLFDNSHSNRHEVIPYSGFDLHYPMISDSEHPFMCLLAIHMSSWEKCLFCSTALFKIGCVFLLLLLLSCMVSLRILDISAILDIWFANIFSYLIGCLFILLMVSFLVQKLFRLT